MCAHRSETRGCRRQYLRRLPARRWQDAQACAHAAGLSEQARSCSRSQLQKIAGNDLRLTQRAVSELENALGSGTAQQPSIRIDVGICANDSAIAIDEDHVNRHSHADRMNRSTWRDDDSFIRSECRTCEQADCALNERREFVDSCGQDITCGGIYENGHVSVSLRRRTLRR